MDLAIEANRNSALFNTMQQVLDVYNPLLTKARPTTVNQTKHNIRVNPTGWGNTFDRWSGPRTVRFDLPRIGSLLNFAVNVSFRIPGDAPTDEQLKRNGERGYAKSTLRYGVITDNTNATTNNARGRLDRVYADVLLGFNMIRTYKVKSKSRDIFTGTGDYLITRFSQLPDNMKEHILKATTPVNIMNPNVEDMFYAPGTTYNLTIPLFCFYNEHVSNGLDLNFSEEVHLDIEINPPSTLFWYGQLGDLSIVNTYAQALTDAGTDIQGYTGAAAATGAGQIAWDQAIHDTLNGNGAADAIGIVEKPIGGDGYISIMQNWTADHIRGLRAPFDDPGTAYGAGLSTATSGPTFAFPDTDYLGESCNIQFEGSAMYLIQDTDQSRALRAQQFPEGSGLTSIHYDISQERFSNLFNSTSANLLDVKSGGSFYDPSYRTQGLTIGNSSYYVDLQLKVNNLCFATHFMVRKHSDMGGDGNTTPGIELPTTVAAIVGATSTVNTVGAHRIYTRCLPVHYFQLLSAGRILYESSGEQHFNLTQSMLYGGTGSDVSVSSSRGDPRGHLFGGGVDTGRTSGKPMYIYSINYGLEASRLENTGSLSFQNLNNPTLRIYFKPDAWAEFSPKNNAAATPKSDALTAALLGVQVDVIHEHWNVITINSGNGEITSGLNQ